MSTDERKDLEEIAERAADRAVSKIFANLGVDPSNPDDLFELRRDLAFIRDARRGTRSVVRLFLSSAAAAIGIAAWLGYNQIIGK